MEVHNYTTEYLIMHEDEIDWKSLSGDASRSFSLVEIRLFRSKIHWNAYLLMHGMTMSLDMLETASKYFTSKEYALIAYLNLGSEEFVLNHLDSFFVPLYLEKNLPSERFLLETYNLWEDVSSTREKLKNEIYSENLENEYSDILLLLESK